MVGFEKYWDINRKKKVFNKFFNTQRSIKHFCKLAFYAGQRYGKKKADKEAHYLREHRIKQFYKREKNIYEREKNVKLSKLENDAFQTALNKTFTEEEINRFFDNHDKIMSRILNEQVKPR